MQKQNSLNYNQQVDFFEDSHTYLKKDGTILKGITGIISKMLFPNKYSNIPEHILNKAAEYGSLIHSKCQENDMFGLSDCIEIDNYVRLKKENELIPLENEYLVSDNERVATVIDNVFHVSDSEVDLGDIKTTSVLDSESLSWQLSICAYLFELQNPHITVRKLYGIWLRREKGKVIEVERKPNNIIIQLLDAYFNEGDFEYEVKEVSEIEELITIDAEMSYLDERRKQLLSIIQPQIEKGGQYKDDRLTISFVEPTTSKSFDSKKFKEENPELVSKYEKETTKAGFLKITYKKEKQ